jgi:CheY-like chemotaxis protein
MDPQPANDDPTESDRLRLLHAYGVLDTPPEAAFDELVAAAARIFDSPAAALTIVARDRCWFKAQTGLGVRELPRTYGLCAYAFSSSGVFIENDAANEPRFRHLPLVTEAGFRFYAGVPLITPEGPSLGTLCVLDRTPRTPTSAQLAELQALTARAVRLLHHRKNSPAVTPTYRPAPFSPSLGRAVLVVDDEPAILRFFAQVLKFQGLPAYCAADGLAALAVYRAHHAEIGLVITDLNMPRLGGLDLIRTLRSESGSPVIAVMTGRLEQETARALAAEHVTHILSKPFSLEDLMPVLALLRPSAETAASGSR